MRRRANAPTPTTSGTEATATLAHADPSPDRLRRLGARITEWGADHRRDFPWRHTADPWEILVSEVMLQQTQAGRVVSYYQAFLQAFPTPTDCARARPADVVRIWSGLGYNRRALNLHRAAQTIATEHAGVIPDDDHALRSLPGIGPATARAVRSFAFGADVAVLDTNVIRVLSRAINAAPLKATQAAKLADRLVPSGRSWEFNQGLFDLGATVCTPRPACAECPLTRMCGWHKSGLADPDPWRTSPTTRPQSRFAGSDRQGRGQLLKVLRDHSLVHDQVAAACGWPDEPVRAKRIAADLVAEGFAEWSPDEPAQLQLR
jgi:A/G-specific adenine glycosylase